MMPKGTQKGPQWDPNELTKTTKNRGPSRDPPRTPKWSQNGAKMDPKWIQNGTKIEPKWSPNERKSNAKERETKPKLMPSPSSPSPPPPSPQSPLPLPTSPPPPSPPQARKTSSNVAKGVSCRGTPRKSREAAGNRRTRQKEARSHGQPTETVDR